GHAATSLVQLSPAQNTRGGYRHAGRRRPGRRVRRGRDRSLPQHEAAAAGAEGRHLADGDPGAGGMGDAGCGVGSRAVRHSFRPFHPSSIPPELPAGRLYANDGINYLTKHPAEILAEVRLPAPNGWDAVYLKLRRRGSFDFPVLGVAAWVKWGTGKGEGGSVAEARIVLGGVASQPQEVPTAGATLAGSDLSDEAIAA